MGPRPFGRGRGRCRPHAQPLVKGRQWGRDRLAAEGPRPAQKFSEQGERQWGRDRLAAEGDSEWRPDKAVDGVNGAATVWPRKDIVPTHAAARLKRRQWGRDRLAAEGCSTCLRLARWWIASMGPRPFGRGRRSPRPRPRRRCRRQWGRDRLAAEGRVPRGCGRRPASVNGAATVWPRKAAGGEQQGYVRNEASMGPRPFGRGRALPRT